MNPSRPDDQAEAEDQAALWAARLEGSSLSSTPTGPSLRPG